MNRHFIFRINPLKNKAGHTLLEMVIALALMAMIMAGCAYLFSAFVRFAKIAKPVSNAEKFQTVHLMLEKQLNNSSEVIVTRKNVYVQDLETSEYINRYEAVSSRGLLMRKKVTKDFKPVQGGTSQFVSGVRDYHFFRDGQNNFKLIMKFDKDGDDETFETVLHYPGGAENIKTR